MSSTIDALVTYVGHNIQTNDMAVAAIAALVYDYALTLPSEIKHVWHAPWNGGKILFLIVRYLPFLELPSSIAYRLYLTDPKVCDGIYIYTTISYSLGILAADIILATRTWAIWKNTRLWAVTLASLCTCAYVASFVITSVFLRSLVYVPFPIPGLEGCFLESASNIIYVSYVLAMAYEAFLFIVTVIKGFEHLRHESTLLVTTLYRDALLFSGATLLVSALNLAVLLALPVSLIDILITPHRILHAILASRVVLHLREASAPASPDFDTLSVEMELLRVSGRSRSGHTTQYS